MQQRCDVTKTNYITYLAPAELFHLSVWPRCDFPLGLLSKPINQRSKNAPVLLTSDSILSSSGGIS